MKKYIRIIIIVAFVIVLFSGVALYFFRGYLTTDVEIINRHLYLGINNNIDVPYSVSPKFSENQLIWEISDAAIADVENGTITGKTEGTAIVTVTTQNGKTDYCDITVSNIIDEWEWKFCYIERQKMADNIYKSYFSVNDEKCTFVDSTGKEYTGTWKYEECRDDVEVYSFDADGLLDWLITISDDSLTVSPEYSSDVVFFFTRK